MTDAQQKWMDNNPEFQPVGPPRKVRFSEWGTLFADGTYKRMANAPRMASIAVGNGAIGVALIAQEGET